MQTAPPEKKSILLSKETLRILILALVTALLWCWAEDRWSAAAWETPVEYVADAGAVDVTALFAAIKTTSEGYCVPFTSKTNPWLGAPYGANWNDYPSNEQFQFFFAGILADTVGIFAAANLWMMMLFVLASASFYFVCRQFRVSWPWAFAGGLVFAFSPFAFGHGQHHLTVAADWHIPLCLLVCTWAARGNGLRWKDWRFRFAVAVAVVTGVQNVYYAVMFIQLLGIGCVIQFLRGRRTAVISAVATGTVTVATFLLMNVSTFVYHRQNGPNASAVHRTFAEIEWTSLKFQDFFIPWHHRIPALMHWGHQYYINALIKGENPPANYFGFAGIIALAWFAARVLQRVIFARPVKTLQLDAIFFAWVFLYSIVGGLNGLLGSLGFLLLRATARYAIILLCIVLIFLVRNLSLLTRRKPPAVAALLAAAMVAVALWDQCPPFKTAEDLKETATWVSSDRRFTEALEKRLPDNAMIFQVPVMDYPEHAAATIPSYEHFRPYLYSTKLRFSFGSDKGRPRADWQHQIESLSFEGMIARLQELGFSAIFVNRRGVTNLARGMVADFKSHGFTAADFIESPNKDLFCVMLKPNPNPAWPLGEVQTQSAPAR